MGTRLGQEDVGADPRAIILSTHNLAEVQANSEMTKLSQGRVVADVELPARLQKSATNPNESREVGMIITNNDMTYVLLDEGVPGEWWVYAIPEDSINHIRYIHDE